MHACTGKIQQYVLNAGMVCSWLLPLLLVRLSAAVTLILKS
jgi:hypothetical protein